MPQIEREQAYRRFCQDGTCSSHFVWFLAELSFFESTHGWIFAFYTKGNVILLPLEPLMPAEVSGRWDEKHWMPFEQAWKEFCAAYPSKVKSFVSISSPFAEKLEKLGFQSTQIGVEPWIDLENCIPRGKTGKGVRSGRNQALRAGLHVEEWKGSELAYDLDKKETLLDVFKDWKSKKLLVFEGFIQAVDPLAKSFDRRYFVANDATGKTQAILVVSPVPGAKSWSLDTLMIRSRAPRGTGELLTLETLVALRESEFTQASLGVIWRHHLDMGMDTFASRFKPERWEAVHMAMQKVDDSAFSSQLGWFQTWGALWVAFRPRIQLSWQWALGKVVHPFSRYPLSTSVGALLLMSFAFIHRFGELSPEAMDRWALHSKSSLEEWFYRSWISDYLYSDSVEFWVGWFACVFALRWLERAHSYLFVLPFVVGLSFFNDWINPWLIAFPSLRLEKDLGIWVLVSTFIGFQLWQFKKPGRAFLGLSSLGAALTFVLSSSARVSAIFNRTHLVFLVLGFFLGKIDLEWKRKRSREVCGNEPPQAKSVRKAA